MMLEISTSEVYNEVDKGNIRLYVKWFDSHFMIVILNSTMELLTGEMSATDIEYYASASKSSLDHFEKIKNALLTKDSRVKFFLHEHTFKLERQSWTLARIELQPISEVKSFASIFRELLAYHEVVQEKLSKLGIKHDLLKHSNDKLIADIEEMIKAKATMEKQLYKKFLLLLNSKKEKIRELKGISKNVKKEKRCIFEERTDESDISDEEKELIVKNKGIKREKRKLQCDVSQSNVNKVRKATMGTSTDITSGSSPIASTSKDLLRNHVHPALLTSDSSETVCELELKDAIETNTVRTSVRCSISAEESEEDLFD